VGTRREGKISRGSSWLRFGFHAVVGRLTGAWVLFVGSRLAMLVRRVRVHCIVTLGHAAQQLGHRRLLGTVPHPEILASGWARNSTTYRMRHPMLPMCRGVSIWAFRLVDDNAQLLDQQRQRTKLNEPTAAKA
jgi:hypothetical protein